MVEMSLLWVEKTHCDLRVRQGIREPILPINLVFGS